MPILKVSHDVTIHFMLYVVNTILQCRNSIKLCIRGNVPLEVRNFQSHEIINVASDRPSKLPTATGKRLILSRFARVTVLQS